MSPEPITPVKAIHLVTDNVRWKILETLDETMSAKEIAEKVGISPSVANYHLRLLALAGAVQSVPDAEKKNRIVYRRAPSFAFGVRIGEHGTDSFPLEGEA